MKSSTINGGWTCLSRSSIYSKLRRYSINTCSWLLYGKGKKSSYSRYSVSISCSRILTDKDMWGGCGVSITIIIYYVEIILISYCKRIWSLGNCCIIWIWIISSGTLTSSTTTIEVWISTTCYLSNSTTISTWNKTPIYIFSPVICYK